jgi:voltage-gated potassium channel Kch
MDSSADFFFRLMTFLVVLTFDPSGALLSSVVVVDDFPEGVEGLRGRGADGAGSSG